MAKKLSSKEANKKLADLLLFRVYEQRADLDADRITSIKQCKKNVDDIIITYYPSNAKGLKTIVAHLKVY